MEKRKRTGIRNRIKSILRGRRGLTLIELIVTFALMGIFAAGTTQIISTAITAYYKMQGLNHARQVSDTLMDKIVGEIQGAQARTLPHSEEQMQISANGAVIELYDRTGSHISIATSDMKSSIKDVETTAAYDTNQLLIYYYPVTDGMLDGAGKAAGETRYEAVDWVYDKGMYMGFWVDSLTFSPAGSEYPDNVIKIELSLDHDKYEPFQSTRYVECYNFNDIGSGEAGPEEPDPEDPDNPDPEDPDKPETGTGQIVVDNNNKNIIDININDNTYNEAWKEAQEAIQDNPGNPGKITFPKGIYEENGQCYIVIEDMTLDAYQFPGTMAGFASANDWEKKCFKLDDTKLYAESDTKGQNEWTNPRPVNGSIMSHGGEYYVCVESHGGWPPTNPSKSPESWVKITDFVLREK